MAGHRAARLAAQASETRADRTAMTRHERIALPADTDRDSKLRVAVHVGIDSLPKRYEALFAEGARQSVFLSRPWFANLAAHAVGASGEPRFYALERGDGMVLALLAMLRPANEPRVLRALAAAYTCDFAPIIDGAGLGALGLTPGRALELIARAIRAERPAWISVRLDYLPEDQPLYDDICAAFGAAGYAVGRYRNFANWYEPVEAPTLEAYMARRPSALRNTIKRKTRKLEQSGDSRFELVTTAAGLKAGLESYEKIYATSWKEPEAFPRFIPGLMRVMADQGWLRLGILHVDGEPAAVQLWLVAEGRAVIYKLAYDPRFAPLSVGSILTLRMMGQAIEADGVTEIDYGSGDDPYKKDWMSRRRERWGMVAFNPFSPKGLLGIGRHGAGRIAAALRGLLGRA
jgi:CelD/BcsL family acetyltransferase involved in cellulose biosynthesis